MSLEIVCDPAQLAFGDMMILDDGLVVLSSEQCSDDLLLLSLIEGCVWHGASVRIQSPVHSILFLVIVIVLLRSGGRLSRRTACLVCGTVEQATRTFVPLSSEAKMLAKSGVGR
jgi:hypothetical protein